MPTSARSQCLRNIARRAVRQALLAGALIALPTLAATPGTSEVVRITSGEWPPFTSEQLPHGGILSHIVTQAFALEGITVEYGYLPWKRAYEYARNGKWDGSVGWAPSAKHLEDLYLSRPVLFVDKALYYRKGDPFDWQTIEDLRRWRVGATAGYYYGAEWERAVTTGHLSVDEVNSDDLNLRKLLRNRVDVVAMEVDVADYLMRTQLTPQEAALIARHPLLLATTPISLALSRRLDKNPALLARFNRGLQRLKDSGAYDRYLAELRTPPAKQTESAGGGRSGKSRPKN